MEQPAAAVCRLQVSGSVSTGLHSAQSGRLLTGTPAQGSQRAQAKPLHVSGVKAACGGAQLSQAVPQTSCRQEDMAILGDPVELAFTQMIQQEFGWRPRSELPMCTACMTEVTSRAGGLDSYAARVTAAI